MDKARILHTSPIEGGVDEAIATDNDGQFYKLFSTDADKLPPDLVHPRMTYDLPVDTEAFTSLINQWYDRPFKHISLYTRQGDHWSRDGTGCLGILPIRLERGVWFDSGRFKVYVQTTKDYTSLKGCTFKLIDVDTITNVSFYELAVQPIHYMLLQEDHPEVYAIVMDLLTNWFNFKKSVFVGGATMANHNYVDVHYDTQPA